MSDLGEPLIQLVRVAVLDDGAFGVLKYKGVPFLCTLERTYEVDGLQKIKIPSGRYRCTATVFHTAKPDPYRTFEIMDVPNCSRILFHIGNDEEDSEGCVIVGDSFGPHDQPSVRRSLLGFQKFWAVVGERSEFVLEVA